MRFVEVFASCLICDLFEVFGSGLGFEVFGLRYWP
jgi:hypothetical protein